MIFSVVDIETTGLQNGYDEILTAHIILTDGMNFIDEKSFNFKPKRITNNYHKSYEIHGITIQQTRGFTDKEVGLSNLLAFVPDNSVMVCHAKKIGHYFDYAFLFMEIELYLDKRLDFYKKFNHCISTHTLSKKFTKLKKRGLKSVSEYYGVVLDNHHNAKSDTHACYEIFKKMYKENRNEIEERINIF